GTWGAVRPGGMKLAECRVRELAYRDEGRPRNVGMELAECRVRELAYRDEGRPRNEVCPRSGSMTHRPRRPTTMANAPELDSTVCPRSGPVTHPPRRPTTV